MSSPPLLRLPVELHLEVVGLLDLTNKVNLAFTTRYFRSIIPTPTHAEFLAAEGATWAKTRQLYTCKGCIRFRHWKAFADDMRKGRWCRSGTLAHTRFCLNCGVSDALYAPGTLLTICNRVHVLCNLCGLLTDQVGDHRGRCAGDYFNNDDDDGWRQERESDRNHLRDLYDCPEEGRLPRY
jgi:hypothetical protein